MKKIYVNEDYQIEIFSDGETMLYDSGSEMIHILNSSATYILSLIKGSIEDDIKATYVAHMKENFSNVEISLLESDCDNIINNFRNSGIVLER
ncbi:PqqD family protein [Clostridium sp.]|uniref:PqqD family protein n=1 Tax=Clostridium sp. TaxID=1506 RepID=UPI003F3E48DB